MTVIEKPQQGMPTKRQLPQLLFPEAHRRRRLRRLQFAFVAALLLGLMLTLIVVTQTTTPSSSPVPPSLRSQTATATEVTPRVAWSDYQGNLHIGDLSNDSQRVVAQTDADPTTSLLVVGNGIFWVRSMVPTPDGTVNPITAPTVQRFDLATGTVTTLGPGNQVFSSVDRSVVYVATGYSELAQFSPSGQPINHDLRLPSGWFLSDSYLLGDPSPALANGILVQSAPVQIGRDASTLAIWDPAINHVKVLGRVWKVIGTFTQPATHSSLIAWLPASCEVVQNCPLEITNSVTLATRSIYSPYRKGFEWGGGFSPDGSMLAAFVPGPRKLSPTARLVLITGSGKVRAVPDTTINNGDSLAWAAWFPDGRRLIVGAVGSPDGVPDDNHYLVDAPNRSARPFQFLADGQSDVNFTVAILPRTS
jgi:hypothetical protein